MLERAPLQNMNNMFLLFDEKVSAYILKLSDQPENAEIIMQNIYAEIHEETYNIKEDERLINWLNTKIKRSFINFFCTEDLDFWDFDELTWQQLEIFDWQIPELNLYFIEPLLNTLPENYRILLKLIEYHELSVEKTGQILGQNKNTVLTDLGIARKKLIELFEACAAYNLQPVNFGPNTMKTAV
ncbi:MAG: hypothetical protein JXJ22_04410 [Bacteroidales bacterium]|nr:hypothetical protein [Bacteroidales bacterium]